MLAGAVDFYILAPLYNLRARAYCKSDIILGKKLGEGGFGAVYRADLVQVSVRPAARERALYQAPGVEGRWWLANRVT